MVCQGLGFCLLETLFVSAISFGGLAVSLFFCTGSTRVRNPGEAQIEEIVKFLAKTGRPRGSSPRSSVEQPGALPTALRWVIYIQVGGWSQPVSTSLIRVLDTLIGKHRASELWDE